MSASGEHKAGPGLLQQGDFTAKTRLLWYRVVGSRHWGGLFRAVALLLFRLIDFFTNLSITSKSSPSIIASRAPANNTLGLVGGYVPVVGGLVVASWPASGSDRICGHGIPEAPRRPSLSAAAACRPRVAILKPVFFRNFHRLRRAVRRRRPNHHDGRSIRLHHRPDFPPHHRRPNARRCWRPARPACMTATFNTPIAAVYWPSNCCSFELKPRSIIPVAIACCVAAAIRPLLVEPGTYIHDPIVHTAIVGWEGHRLLWLGRPCSSAAFAMVLHHGRLRHGMICFIA